MNFSRNAALGGSLFSITVFSGLGPIVGAMYLTYCTMTEKYTNLFTFLPVVHILVFINFSMQNTDLIDQSLAYRSAGLILIIEGLLYTFCSSKTDYAWKIFRWDDEDAFFSWLDTLGILAMGYVVVGFCLAMTEFDPDEFIWALMAVYLAGVGLQGFREETEAPWRRGFGSFGTILSLFALSMEFSSEGDSIFTYVTWMFIGIVAFGFGILYMNRLGEISNLYEIEDKALGGALTSASASITDLEL